MKQNVCPITLGHPVQIVLLQEMMSFINGSMSPQKRNETSNFVFRNAFFFLDFQDDETADENDLMTIRKTQRLVEMQRHKMRSKYICDPRKLIEAGNHFVWESIEGQQPLHVSEEIGFLHHYRECLIQENGKCGGVDEPNIFDRTVPDKYGQELTHRVYATIEKTSNCFKTY